MAGTLPLAILAILFLSSIIPSLFAALNPGSLQAGIATFRFKFTESLGSINHVTISQELNHAPTTLRGNVRSAVGRISTTTPILGAQAVSAAGAATAVPGVVSELQNSLDATAVPGAVVSRVQSVSSAATSLTGAIEDHQINWSIGMRDFCIGASCHKLPLDILDLLLPEHVKESLQKELGYLNDATARATPSYLRNCLIAGTAFLFVLAIITGLHIKLDSITRTLFRTALYLALCLVCLVFLVIPTVVSKILQSKLQSVPLVTVVSQGEAHMLCFVALCFAFFLMAMGFVNVIPFTFVIW